MSIGTKIILVLGVVVVVYLGLSFTVLRTIIDPAFDDLESEFARQDVARIENALAGLTAQLDALNVEWSQWTQTRDFLLDHNEDFIEEEAAHFDYKSTGVNAFILSDVDGSIVWSHSVDPATGNPIASDALFGAPYRTLDELIGRATNGAGVMGLVRTQRGPAFVSARPVFDSTGSGPIAGSVLLLSVIDTAELEMIGESVQVDFDLLMVRTGAPLPAGFELVLNPGSDPQMQVSENTRVALESLADVYEQPVFLLRVESPRHITSVGDRAVSLAFVALVLGAAVLTLAIWIILQRMIISPIGALTRSMLGLAEELSDPERRNQTAAPERRSDSSEKAPSGRDSTPAAHEATSKSRSALA